MDKSDNLRNYFRNPQSVHCQLILLNICIFHVMYLILIYNIKLNCKILIVEIKLKAVKI